MANIDFLVEVPTDKSVLVRVPGGPFLAGGSEHYEGNCQPFWVEVPDFYIGLHPVTNAQYKRFVDSARHAPPRVPSSGSTVWSGKSYPEDLADHPVVNVTWQDALDYCEWAELRLPGELEWEKAARGSDNRRFPWGSEWRADLCRNDVNRRTETTSSVWDYPAGVSESGCYQMSGNIWEWCADWYHPDAYRRYARGHKSPPENGKQRLVRGGSWFNVAEETFGCAYRFHMSPTETDTHYGFRVARHT